MATELGDVILVGAADFLDQSMYSQAFETVRDLSSCLSRYMASKIFVAHAADGKFPAYQRLEQRLVFGFEQVIARVGPSTFVGCLADSPQGGNPCRRIVDLGEEGQIPHIGAASSCRRSG